MEPAYGIIHIKETEGPLECVYCTVYFIKGVLDVTADVKQLGTSVAAEIPVIPQGFGEFLIVGDNLYHHFEYILLLLHLFFQLPFFGDIGEYGHE
jgi:hypothetical protein